MTYKEIVLKLLKSRDGLICVEHHLLNDFREYEDPFIHLDQWCKEHSITFQRIAGHHPPKLSLKKVLCEQV
ncbi:MAG: hypothetical protein R6U64_10025 [Bacteroidales bacterium]